MKKIIIISIILSLIGSLAYCEGSKKWQFIDPKKVEKRYSQGELSTIKKLYKPPTKSGLSPEINPSDNPYNSYNNLNVYRNMFLKGGKQKEIEQTEKQVNNYLKHSKEAKEIRKQLLGVLDFKKYIQKK